MYRQASYISVSTQTKPGHKNGCTSICKFHEKLLHKPLIKKPNINHGYNKEMGTV